MKIKQGLTQNINYAILVVKIKNLNIQDKMVVVGQGGFKSEIYQKTTKSHSIVVLFYNVPVRKDHF